MGLYTPTILGGNSYLSWFYDRGAIKDPAPTGTSKRLSQAINGRPIRKFLPKYANVYVTIKSHGLSAGVRPHDVTANRVRNGLLSARCVTRYLKGKGGGRVTGQHPVSKHSSNTYAKNVYCISVHNCLQWRIRPFGVSYGTWPKGGCKEKCPFCSPVSWCIPQIIIKIYLLIGFVCSK